MCKLFVGVFVDVFRVHFRLRTAYLRLQSRQISRREQGCIAALVVLEEQQARERERTVWVKPWLQRRVTLGHFDTLMQELMRESRGDFKSYLEIEPAMFQEMVNIVTVTVSPYSLCTEAARAPYDPIESLRRLCGDCTEIARLPYNLRAASVRICPDQSPRVRTKYRTIIVYYVNTYAVARSHMRCPKKRTENRRRSYRTAPVANVN